MGPPLRWQPHLPLERTPNGIRSLRAADLDNNLIARDGDPVRQFHSAASGFGQDLGHLSAREALCRQQRYALAAVNIDGGEHSYGRPICQRVVHEIHRPLLVWSADHRPLDPNRRAAPPLRSPPSESQALFAVEPVDPLVIHPPTLATKVVVRPPVAGVDPNRRQLP